MKNLTANKTANTRIVENKTAKFVENMTVNESTEKLGNRNFFA